jgi:O-methyltransferase involved in polyketide biosynthesis
MNAAETSPPSFRAATPDVLDTSKPNVARAYDYLLGGKDNFPADRELAEKLVAIYPGVRQMVKENRRFLVRALDYVLAQAIGGYIDLGAGLPTTPAVHDIVCRQDNTATVLYVDNDPVVASHLRALTCTDDARVQAIRADLARPADVIRHAREAGLIDLDEPACLILASVLHFFPAGTARDLVKTYANELAPGSYVIITVARGEQAIGDQITRTYDAATVYNHTHDEVVSFFAGLELIPPGVCDARAWMPGWATPAPFYDRAGQVLAGVGLKL